jgi:hypothetical protein
VGYEGVIKRPDFSQLRTPFEQMQAQSGATQGQGIAETAPGIAAAATPNRSPIRPIAEGMRQMVHELRSPLNAINGFAQLIDGQYFGPVAARYRELAQSIMADASMLGLAFDDLDVAARLDMGTIALRDGQSDLSAILKSAISTVIVPAGKHPVAIDISGLGTAIFTPIGQADLKRIVARLFNALTQIVAPDEKLTGSLELHSRGDLVSLHLSRPAQLEGLDIQPPFGEAHLSTVNGDASIIGFAPTLHLVNQLAALHGGALLITDDQFILNLPTLSSDSDRVGSSG